MHVTIVSTACKNMDDTASIVLLIVEIAMTLQIAIMWMADAL